MAKAKKEKTPAQLESAYVHGDISQRALAEKFGVPYSRVTYYAKRNNWTEKRAKYRQKVRAKSDAKAAARESDRLARLGVIADNLVSTLEEAAADRRRFNRVGVKTQTGGFQVVETEIFDSAAFKQVTAALKELTDVIRDVYNLPKAQAGKENVDINLILPEGMRDFDR